MALSATATLGSSAFAAISCTLSGSISARLPSRCMLSINPRWLHHLEGRPTADSGNVGEEALVHALQHFHRLVLFERRLMCSIAQGTSISSRVYRPSLARSDPLRDKSSSIFRANRFSPSQLRREPSRSPEGTFARGLRVLRALISLTAASTSCSASRSANQDGGGALYIGHSRRTGNLYSCIVQCGHEVVRHSNILFWVWYFLQNIVGVT